MFDICNLWSPCARRRHFTSGYVHSHSGCCILHMCMHGAIDDSTTSTRVCHTARASPCPRDAGHGNWPHPNIIRHAAPGLPRRHNNNHTVAHSCAVHVQGDGAVATTDMCREPPIGDVDAVVPSVYDAVGLVRTLSIQHPGSCTLPLSIESLIRLNNL